MSDEAAGLESGRAAAARAELRAAFAGELLRLAEVYQRPVSEMLADTYFTALDEFSIDEVRQAVAHAIRTTRFSPRPAELIETIRQQRRERRRALAESERTRALPAAEVSEEERQTVLAQIRAFTSRLVGA